MRNKKSVLMPLNHNYGCFSTVAGIAGNVFALGAVADFGAQNCQYTTKADGGRMFN